jgi:two-component sensor histidine kinase
MNEPLDFRLKEFYGLLIVTLVVAVLFFALHLLGFSVDILVVSAFLIGRLLGLQARVFIILPTSAALILITAAVHLAKGHDAAVSIALNILVVVTVHQVGYLFGVASAPYVSVARSNFLSLRRKLSTRDATVATLNEQPESNDLKRSENTKAVVAASDRRPTPITLTPTGELLSAIEKLSRAVDADAIHEIIRTSARQLIGSDGVALILADGDLCHYVEEDAIGPLWKGRKFKMTECISGWSMMNRMTAVIPDISTDKRIPYHLYATTFVKSLVMTPVGLDGPIAALGAYWASTYEPTAYEIETVKTLARSTATALENAKLVSMLSRSLAQAEMREEELRHRAENAYLTARSLAHVSLAPELAEAFTSRLMTFAQTHEAVDKKLSQQKRIDIKELMQSELEAFGGAGNSVTVEGASVALDREQAIVLGVAVNEMMTSALKGAGARVQVSWRVDSNCLRFEWRAEHKARAVFGVATEGFDPHVLQRLVEDRLGGTLRCRLGDDSVVSEIEFPLEKISPPSAAEKGAWMLTGI